MSPLHSMSNTPVQEPATQGLSSGSGQTLPSRPLQPSSDPSASKRVCFYKSGDYQFSGHRMVINARTFKTFDALLDALSKKVPLPFGVRTITTPRGTHLVKALDDLQDGGAYVCSDQKRVKPLNLDEVNRRQVPWNTTRPLSAGRRRRKGLRFSQFGSRNEVTNRPAKVTERVAVRTPKRLMVIKNRDPTVKRTIVLQRRTAPTFDALLDYLSQILQFPVLKLYSTDGRRVDGLATLILCSGVVVAAGNEPFRLANYSFHRVGQMAQAMHVETVEPSMLQPRAQKNKPFSSGRGSRNFSLSSERYIINQINKSQNGSMNSNLHPHNGSFETGVSQHCTSMETSGPGRADNEHHTSIVPQDDDIEKSFRVNQDGSMTVEMKVRLTIKEEEMLQWTTTLSRTSLSKSPGCASVSESGNRSPDSNNAIAKDSSSISEEETKEENYPTGTRKGVGFDDERIYEGYTSIGMGKAKKSVKRTPTPGPRHVNKTASVESVKKVTELGVQESMLGHYSYMERRADGETTEGYCVVRHSTSSNRPIPKPRKTASAGASNKCSTSSLRSSGVAEVLQIQNNGIEVTETVMHIYETQGCYDNYFANQEYGIDGVPLHGSPSAPESKQSTESGSQSSSNDCDIDCSWQPPTADSLQRQKEEMLSLSSEPVSQTHENKNNLSSRSEIEVQRNPQIQERVKHDNTPKSTEKKNLIRPAGNQKSSTSTSSTDKKLKESPFRQSKNGKHSSADKLSKTSVEKSLNSSGSGKNSPKSKEAELKAENTLSKKSDKDEKTPKKDSAKNLKRTPQRQNTNKAAAKDNGHNVNTPTGRPQMKKNMSDILQPKKSLLLGKETNSNPKSMSESRISSTKTSVSMPSLDPSPSEIHQYVENWLEKVSPDQVPYTEVAITEGTQPRMKVVFQIGGDSESDEKTECQTNLDEYCLSPDDGFKKSTSCLSVPLSHEEPAIAQGLSVSMPNVRADPLHQESRLKSHKSAEAIGPAHDETSSSNFLSPKTKIKPVLQQLCSSIQCIRRASDTNTNVTSNLEKSNSLPDFPTQVASVFGSSCKAFLSFLSVMTLRDHLTTSASEECSKSSTSSEAMLMMESLQKISATEDEEEQRASLTDLQSRASSRMRQRWKDFQILRERLESEPLSPKFSETEFALDVVSEGGDIFEEQNLGIDELMEELRMPQDLREEIASTFKSFYPVEESQCVETDRNQSDSEEDVEQFIKECNDETEQSPESDSRYVAEDISETKHGSDNAVHNQQGHKLSQTDQEPGEAQDSQTEKDEFLKENETKEEESGEEEQLEEVEEMKIREYGDKKEMGTESEENENEDREKEEEEEEEPHQSEKEGSEEFIDKDEEGIDEEEEMTLDEKEAEDELEEGEIEDADETEEAFMNEDSREQSAEETDEREGIEEAEEEERINDKDKEGVEEENSDVEDEERQEEENSMKKEVDANMKETDEAEKVENVTEEREQETDEETDEEQGVENVTKEVEQEEEEEEEEETEESHPLPESVEQEEEEEKTEESHSLPESVEEEEEEEETEESHPLPKSVEKEEEEEETEESHSLPKSVEEEEGAEEEETEELHPLPKSVEKEVKEEETEESHSLPESVEEEEGEEEEETEETHPLPENVEDEREVSDVYSEEKEMGDGTEADEEEEVEEETCVITVTDAEEDVVDTEDGELEMEVVTEDRREDDAGEEEATEQITEVVREGINEEEEVEKKGEHEQGGGGDSVVNTEEERARIVTDEEEVNEERVTDIEDQKYDDAEDSKTEQEKTENNLEEESAEETEPVEELEMNENLTAGHIVEGEDEDDDDENEFQEKLDHKEKQGTESPSKYSSEGQCADDKGNGTDTVTELETDEGGEMRKQRGGSVPHPVEISQELLDFVNYALQSSSLIFIYDTEGNIRIEPDNARFVPTRQIVIPKSRKYSSYGLKRLPSPVTSDLSDYRPETSESGGYKTQDSVDIISESGEEASEKPSPVYSHSSDQPERTNVEWANSKLSVASNSETFHSSSDSGTKVSREDLSYFSAASSLKADAEANAQGAQCISFVSENPTDGVLIDQGRWLLKENHLIRKSPPVSLGMYGNLDSSSLDTGQENISDDSPPHYKTQHSPLAAISSSELEEMAKPQTPKCIYYNMPHGSDSDPFLDDSSIKSSIKGRGVKVSPTIDTSKTWANKNGSQSSFASVEFRIPDRKVHPEDESTVVTQPRRTPSGEGRVLQAQDSMDNLHVRCGQYCPIL